MLIKLNRTTPNPNHSGRGEAGRPKGAEGKERGPREQVWLLKGQQKDKVGAPEVEGRAHEREAADAKSEMEDLLSLCLCKRALGQGSERETFRS